MPCLVSGSDLIASFLPGTSVPNSLWQSPRHDVVVPTTQSTVTVFPSHSVSDLCPLQETNPLLRDFFWRRKVWYTSAEAYNSARGFCTITGNAITTGDTVATSGTLAPSPGNVRR